MRPALLVCAALLCAAATVQAAVSTGTVSSSDGFAFLDKFCFNTNGPVDPSGTVTVDVTLPTYGPNKLPQSDLVMVLYDDETDAVTGSWNAILDNWDEWSCDEKVAWTKGYPRNATSMTGDDHSVSLSWELTAFQQNTRPRFWFVAIARCNGGFNNMDYKVHFTQADSSAWNREFGVNESGLNSLYLAFFFIFTVLLIVNCVGTYQLQQRLSYLHPMIKLFLLVLITEYIAIFVLLLHYGSYAQNGSGIVLLMKLGQVLAIVSRSLFILLLILLAKGWTISRESLTKKWAVIAVVFAYLVVSIVILVWSYAMQDPMRTTPGTSVVFLTIALGVVWLVFAVWFAVEIFAFSYAKEDNPAKRSMYLKLGVIFLPWFTLPPLMGFAVFGFDPWVRERVIAALQVTISTVAYAVLVFFFWPSRAEEYFSIATPDIMSRGDEDYATL